MVRVLHARTVQMITADLPPRVVRALLIFTFALFLVPLSGFFILREAGVSSLWSGLTAALLANIVLAVYVFVAFSEEPSKSELEKKKE